MKTPQFLSLLLQLKGHQPISHSELIQGYLRALSVADKASINVILKHDPTLLRM